MTITIIVLALIIAALLAERHHDTRAWAVERADLLNRIKPETAQPLGGAPVEMPESVHPDIDDEYWESKGVTV